MSYLERNSRLIPEVGANLHIKRGAPRGDGALAIFHSAGRYNSAELGTEIYVGLKERKDKTPSSGELLRARFIFELAIMSVVAQNMPHLLPELPLFYGLIEDRNGVTIAIVTEDFSKDGQNYVDGGYASIPTGLKDIFVGGTVDEDHLAGVGFMVYPRGEQTEVDGLLVPPNKIRRLGDFYPLVNLSKRNVHKTHFPEEQIEGELDRHTLKVTYEL